MTWQQAHTLSAVELRSVVGLDKHLQLTMQSLQSPQLDAMLPSGTSPRSPVSSLRQIFMRQGQAGMVSRFSIRHLAADAVSGRVPRRWKPQAVPANYGAKPSSHAHSFSGLRADGGIVSLLSGGAGSFNCSCSAMSLGACQSCNSTNAHANKGGCSIRLRWRQQLGKQGMVLVNASNRSTGHQSMDSDEVHELGHRIVMYAFCSFCHRGTSLARLRHSNLH